MGSSPQHSLHHGSHGSSSTEAVPAHAGHLASIGGSGPLKDPVCGMAVTEASAHRTVHAGHPYFFCSAGCKAKFEADPARYIPEPTGAAQAAPEHGHGHVHGHSHAHAHSPAATAPAAAASPGTVTPAPCTPRSARTIRKTEPVTTSSRQGGMAGQIQWFYSLAS